MGRINAAFEVLYEWSKTLQDDHIDEDQQEIEQNNRTVTSRSITVRGRRDDVAIVVHYDDLYNTSSFTSRVPVYKPHILEFFRTDNHIPFSGELKRKGLWQKLFGGGLKPNNHQLFQKYMLVAEERNADLSLFESDKVCEGLFTLMQLEDVWKVEFQEKTGVSTFFSIHGNKLTPRFLDSVFDMMSSWGEHDIIDRG